MYDYKYNSVQPKATQSFASAATVATWQVLRSSDVYSLNAQVQVSPTTTATILTFYYNPIPGSATNQATIGTLTIPVGAAVGKVYKRNVGHFNIPEGGEIICVVSQVSAAGSGSVYCIFGEDPESDLGAPNVVVVSA